jgi:hypothetical protein
MADEVAINNEYAKFRYKEMETLKKDKYKEMKLKEWETLKKEKL